MKRILIEYDRASSVEVVAESGRDVVTLFLREPLGCDFVQLPTFALDGVLSAKAGGSCGPAADGVRRYRGLVSEPDEKGNVLLSLGNESGCLNVDLDASDVRALVEFLKGAG